MCIIIFFYIRILSKLKPIYKQNSDDSVYFHLRFLLTHTFLNGTLESVYMLLRSLQLTVLRYDVL